MQPPGKNYGRSRKATAAFTLAEVLIASTLSVLVMSAVMSSVFLITRSGYAVEQYADMEEQSRVSLEIFGRDVRMAQSVTWVDANTITLTIPLTTEGSATTQHTYFYKPTTHEFWRTADGKDQLLISGINTLTLSGYQLTGDPVFTASTPPTTPFDWQVAGTSTKQLELSVSSSRQQGIQIQTSQKIISARFILRNKQTS